QNYDKTVSNEYFLNLGQTRDISALQWYDSKCVGPSQLAYSSLGDPVNKVKINIYSSGIIFHDVLVATGRIPMGPEAFVTDCAIGTEYAGRRADTGQRVMGMELSRCYATSVYSSTDAFTHIPDHWSMDDAVSILSTYSTVYYGLIQMAKLRTGESVLIHSAAGGVGQAALNICQHYKCDIYATVGTDEKK
ncbi:unnamed protein product, partial [Oppiella nova]